METPAGNPVEEAARKQDRNTAESAAPKKRAPRKPKPDAAPAGTPTVQIVEVTFSGVTAKEVSRAVEVLLSQFTQRTKTEPPNADEVNAISEGLAVGLKHTKFAIDPKTGPWVPLAIAASAFALPRLVDLAMRYVRQREEAKRSTFREDIRIDPTAEIAETPSGVPVES